MKNIMIVSTKVFLNIIYVLKEISNGMSTTKMILNIEANISQYSLYSFSGCISGI